MARFLIHGPQTHERRASVARAERLRGAAARIDRVPWPIWVVAIAALAWLVSGRTIYPHYDFAYSIAAGQDILDGRLNAYSLGLKTPLPHPLGILMGIVSAAFGSAAFPVWIALSTLFFGLAVYAVFDLGRHVWSWPVGLLAAALVFTSPLTFRLAERTYGDIKFAALVLFAAALEARKPRRGWAVLAVLVPAGLLRPEAWILAGIYWIYVFPSRGWRERAGMACLVLAGPLLWSLSDLLLTGDPLYSREHAKTFASRSERGGLSPAEAPSTLIEYVKENAGTYVIVVGSVVGAALSVTACRLSATGSWRRTLTPIALAAIAAVLPVALALAGGTIVAPRFFVVPGILVALFFSAAVLGWIGVAERGLRRPWIAVGAIAAAALVTQLPARAAALERQNAEQAERASLMRSLDAWILSPEVKPYLERCRPIMTDSFYFRPFLRFWLDAKPLDVSFDFPKEVPPRGVVVVRSEKGTNLAGPLAASTSYSTGRTIAAGLRSGRLKPVAQSDLFTLYATAGCR